DCSRSPKRCRTDQMTHNFQAFGIHNTSPDNSIILEPTTTHRAPSVTDYALPVFPDPRGSQLVVFQSPARPSQDVERTAKLLTDSLITEPMPSEILKDFFTSDSEAKIRIPRSISTADLLPGPHTQDTVFTPISGALVPWQPPKPPTQVLADAANRHALRKEGFDRPESSLAAERRVAAEIGTSSRKGKTPASPALIEIDFLDADDTFPDASEEMEL
ncbi:hypothetical protein CYMTET_44242, partial [Cymbomonas tetramitiformis]